MSKILLIDDLTRRDHSNLTGDDICYYFMNYTAHKGATYSEANQLVYNFKKPVRYRDTHHYHYKIRAINTVAELLRRYISPIFDLSNCTLVAIPPSKTKSHDDYDDRVNRTLSVAFPNGEFDVRDLIIPVNDIRASHESADRPTVEELYDNLVINRRVIDGVNNTIILFDDVITTGAHFRACKSLLLQTYPNAEILGVFIARREVELDFDFKFWDED